MLTGSYVDAEGQALRGSVQFTPISIGANGDNVVIDKPVYVKVSDGTFSVDLIPSDDPNWNTTGDVVYRVYEDIGGQQRSYVIAVPSVNADIKDLQPIDDPQYVLAQPADAIVPDPSGLEDDKWLKTTGGAYVVTDAPSGTATPSDSTPQPVVDTGGPGVSAALSRADHAHSGVTQAEFDAHDHDDTYYTEAEVDAALAGKENTGTAAAAVTAHHDAGSADHDDRYYTESEVDAALAGKENTGVAASAVASHETTHAPDDAITEADHALIDHTGLPGVGAGGGDHADSDHADTFVAKAGDSMTGNLTLDGENGKVIFKDDAGFMGFVIQREDGTRRFVMESDDDDSGDGQLSFGTYNASGGGFRQAFFIRNREGEATGLLYVPSYFVAGGDARVDGLLSLTQAPTADDHAATKKYVDDNAGGLPSDNTYAADPGVPEIRIQNDYFDGDISLRNLLEIVSNGTLTAWLNEWGALRLVQPSENPNDAGIRIIRGDDRAWGADVLAVQPNERGKNLLELHSSGVVRAVNVGQNPVMPNADSDYAHFNGPPVRLHVDVPWFRWTGEGVTENPVKKHDVGPGDSPFQRTEADVSASGGVLTFPNNARIEFGPLPENDDYWFTGRWTWEPGDTSVQFLRVTDASQTPIFHMRLAGSGGNTGAVRIYDESDGQTESPVFRGSLGTEYDLHVHYKFSTGLVTAYIYDTSGTLLDSWSRTTDNTRRPLQVWYGCFYYNTTAVTQTVQSPAVSGVQPGTVPPLMPIWTGTQAELDALTQQPGIVYMVVE